MLDQLTTLERSMAETMDDVELFIFWHEQRIANNNVWARLLGSEFATKLFEAGVRSVAALATLSPDDPLLTGLSEVGEYREALVAAAKAWTPLPQDWREETARLSGYTLPGGDGAAEASGKSAAPPNKAAVSSPATAPTAPETPPAAAEKAGEGTANGGQ